MNFPFSERKDPVPVLVLVGEGKVRGGSQAWRRHRRAVALVGLGNGARHALCSSLVQPALVLACDCAKLKRSKTCTVHSPKQSSGNLLKQIQSTLPLDATLTRTSSSVTCHGIWQKPTLSHLSEKFSSSLPLTTLDLARPKSRSRSLSLSPVRILDAHVRSV